MNFTIKDIKNLLENNFKDGKIIGLGKAGFLAKISPSLFAFNLFFIRKNV